MNQAFGLDAFNFTLAGAREGFGRFLGVYLQHQGFDPARTGFAMSLAGLAGIAATAPLGALIDRITAKRAAVVLAVTCIAIGAVLVVASKQLWIVAAGQVYIGIADSSLAPFVAALTLGLVGRERYADRVARNEAFNHAGNAVNAALAALLGYLFGLGYVAAAIGVMALATVMEFIRPDDELVVVKLDRLGRSTGDVLNLVHELEEKGAALTVLEPNFSTKDATGSILVTVLGMVAEMERKFIRERQQTGIEAAKGRGVYTGRKATAPVDKVRQLYASGMAPSAIAKETCLSRMQVYRITKDMTAKAIAIGV